MRSYIILNLTKKFESKIWEHSSLVAFCRTACVSHIHGTARQKPYALEMHPNFSFKLGLLISQKSTEIKNESKNQGRVNL